jgi:hypothetical protein
MIAMPLHAQRAARSPYSITAFAGGSVPVGTASDDLNTGYTLGVAGDLRSDLKSPLGFRAEASYSNWGAKGVSGTGVSAKGTDLGLNLNAVLWVPTVGANAPAPYVTAGGSFARLEASAQSGGMTFSETANHFGFNVGGGIDIPIGEIAARIDVRYKQISTDSDSFKSIPITFGIRF